MGNTIFAAGYTDTSSHQLQRVPRDPNKKHTFVLPDVTKEEFEQWQKLFTKKDFTERGK